MSAWRAREAREATTYGSARFATEREVRAAGLLGEDGVILGPSKPASAETTTPTGSPARG